MRFLLRDYVALLRESGELDVLLPDLFLAMGLEPLTKAQVGVRQHGVDASAVGPDPETGVQTLFLATIKPGDVSRATWNGSPTAVRPSLDEVLDVYHQSRLPAKYALLPVRILLVCGGDLKQDAEDNWNGFVKRYTQAPSLGFDLWTGERLALLIEAHMLDEHLFPDDARQLMRKALALLDQNEDAPVLFYALVEQVLSGDAFTGASIGAPRRRVKALHLLALCLGVVAKWADDAKNTRPAVLAAERVVLSAWDFLRVNDAFDHAASMDAFGRIYRLYLRTGLRYLARVQPLCLIQDGLSGTTGDAERLEYPLRTFEVLGIVATVGLNFAFLALASGTESDQRAAQAAATTVAEIIANHAVAGTPLYDGHSVEIALGTSLLAVMQRTGEAAAWLGAVFSRVEVAFRVAKYFPVASDRYEDLLALERGDADIEDLQSMSTLIPTLAEWLAVLGRDDDYAALVQITDESFARTTFQLWFPGDDTDDHLYRTHAAIDSGAVFGPMPLLPTAPESRERMKRLGDAQDAFDRLSCIAQGFPALGLLASRHFRTPVAPTYWQRLGAHSVYTAAADDVSG